jgi:hypothetical protein
MPLENKVSLSVVTDRFCRQHRPTYPCALPTKHAQVGYRSRAMCVWVSDQCALTMLHPLPTLAGDRAPFIPIKLVAFLSPLPPLAPSLPARSLGTSTNSHATRTSKLGCGSRRTSGCGGDAKAECCTDRRMQASADASFVGAIMWIRFVRAPLLSAQLFLSRSAHPRCAHVPPPVNYYACMRALSCS